MKNKIHNLITGLSLIIILVGSINFFSFYSEKMSPQQAGAMYNQFKTPQIPEDISFAGERVPVEYFDVKESLDQELIKTVFWHSQTLILLKRANRFFPMIEKILEENGIPEDFKYLAVAESSLSNVSSGAGAKGLWQFMESTAKKYGMEINSYVDERYDYEISTRNACRYLKESYSRFGNWTLAAASYNVGGGRIATHLKEQKIDNYYDMHMNSETARYIYRILSYKIIFENPANYDFIFEQSDLYEEIPSDTIIVNTAIEDLKSFAIENNVNYKLLKQMNPWLRDSYLQNKTGKTYKIIVPKPDFRASNFAQIDTTVITNIE